jgi:hypothetical protein
MEDIVVPLSKEGDSVGKESLAKGRGGKSASHGILSLIRMCG